VGFSLVTLYPLWLLLLCLMAGAVYATILYYRDKENDFSRTLTKTLAALRFITVTVIAFLLLSPLLKSATRRTEKPVVLLASDNSASITVGRDSVYYKNEFGKNFLKLAGELSKKFEVHTYSFGDQVVDGIQSDHTGKLTDIAQLFGEVKDRYSNRNLAALIIASDGIFNQGANPLYVAENAPYSIYTVALGDTMQQKDIFIARVNYNRIAFLGNDFPVEITLTAYKCAGATGKVSIATGAQQLYAESYSVNSQQFTRTFTSKLTATKPGLQRYRISISPVPGEISLDNNFQDIFVEVLDSRQKILILQSAPHPDIAAIRKAIEKNRNYEVGNFMLGDFKGSLAGYSLVILHQIPAVNDIGFQITNQLKTLPLPVLYVLGSQSNLPAYNNLMPGLMIPATNASMSEATALFDNDFSLFSISPEIEKLIPEFPPLLVPFGQYKPGTAAQVLLNQKIGNVATKIPLIIFNQGVDRKSATIAGEGIWRWRMANFTKAGNQLAFDELFSKIVQYLVVKEDKSQFRIVCKNHFNENEAVEIDAELYNDSYELVNDPDVNIVITDENDKNFPFTFTRTSNAYYLNAGSLPAGEYKYNATTRYAGKTFEKNGMFTVLALNIEWMNTVADYGLLNTLASTHQGKMVFPSQLDQIPGLLAARDDFKTVAYSQKRYTDLVSFFPILLLILGLLTAEWFVRKRNGSY